MLVEGMDGGGLLSQGMDQFGLLVIEIGEFTLYRHAVVATEDGYLLAIDVTSAADVGPELFVHHLSPYRGGQAQQVVFSHIASPAALEEYPTEAEATNGAYYFRRSSVRLVFRSLAKLHAGWLAIGSDVQNLVESLDQLAVVEEVTEQVA